MKRARGCLVDGLCGSLCATTAALRLECLCTTFAGVKQSVACLHLLLQRCNAGFGQQASLSSGIPLRCHGLQPALSLRSCLLQRAHPAGAYSTSAPDRASQPCQRIRGKPFQGALSTKLLAGRRIGSLSTASHFHQRLVTKLSQMHLAWPKRAFLSSNTQSNVALSQWWQTLSERARVHGAVHDWAGG